MICDIHVHTADISCQRTVERLVRMRRSLVGRLSSCLPLDVCTSQGDPIVRPLEASGNTAAVLLGLDCPYDEDGVPREAQDFPAVSNEYVAGLARRHRKVLFGASIHPYRKDALAALHKAVADGACLVKWLPSAQNIDPANPLCLPFYDLLAHYGIPLLSHTGREHVIRGGRNAMNDPRRLLPALQRGVTVIAAHCGARMFLHEPCFFPHWRDMARTYENFYGDTGAFVTPTRQRFLRELLQDPELLAKVLYASDIPARPLAWSCLLRFGFSETRALARETNVFDLSFAIFRKMGFPDDFFSNGWRLLRIPQEKRDVLHV